MLSCLCTDAEADNHEANMDTPTAHGADQGVTIPRVTAKVDEVNANVYTVTFEKGRGLHGLRLSHVEDLLVIEDVGSGTLSQWNDSQKDDATVIQPMDRVIAVNSQKGSAEELMDLVNEGGTITLMLEHPRYLSVELKRKKGDKMLGVEVTTHEGGLGVVILGVQDNGLFPTYNSNAEPELQIKAYSSIYAINGKRWPSVTLLRMLQKLDEFKISMRTWS
ncbi:PGA [Symbiodinium pilosum]|uniref:PGA protein n=1 Tax=Symbiodinium pilosum TaxID=2952 RepID=A0A812WHH7_SYMPI|nr:PGA [Symbiodinium pilosum]